MTESFEPIDTLAGPGEAKSNTESLARILRKAFPEAVNEGGIDFDVLRELVGEEALTPATERFGLSWPGKAASRRLALLPPTGTLLPRPDESVNWESTKNLVIEGDNLEVLRLLRRAYAGKVDVIYIDPPYNTGSDLVYHDSRVTSKDDYEAQVGERDGEGKLVKNTDASGHRHAAWLDMMHPRLWAARDLLKESGVIIAAIDDNEHANLRLLLDHVFGAENFLANVVWQGGSKNDARFTAQGIDYMLIYARNVSRLIAADVRWTEPKKGHARVMEVARETWEHSGHDAVEATRLYRRRLREIRGDLEPAVFRYDQIDESGRPFRTGDLAKPSATGSSRYDLRHPVTGLPVKMPKEGWRFSPDTMAQRIAEGRVVFGADHTTTPALKRYLDEMDTQAIKPVFTRERASAAYALRKLLNSNAFPYTKDVDVLATWIDSITMGNRDALILDFFAGSGSTGHAVMNLNAADSGKRQFILVQIDEPVEGDSRFATIPEITRERLRRASQEVATAQGLGAATLDLGFRSYRLADSNIRSWDGRDAEQSLEEAVMAAVDNLLPGRTADDLLVEMMLRLGVEVTTPVEQREIAGSPLFNLGGGAMFAYFGTGITVEVSKKIADEIRSWRDDVSPVTEAAVVVRDTGFADSGAKLNFAAALNQASITNLRSI